MDYKKELQVRFRVESIFNKTEDEFVAKTAYDDYLEEREDIIFNLVEGIDVKDMEAKIAEYKRNNADSIIRNEAKKAEALRQKAAEEVEAGVPGPERADVSGTAAAFQDGAGAEPHQGMEYTAEIPSGAAMASTRGTVPLTAVGSGADLATASGEQTRDQWKAMALASGWTPEFQKKKALQTAFGSMFITAAVK